VLDLSAAPLLSPVYQSRARLLHVLALDAGIPVRGGADEEMIRRQIRSRYESSDQTRLKRWSKVELAAMHILLELRAGDSRAVVAAKADLACSQSSDGSFYANLVSTALAYIALVKSAPESFASHRCRDYLVSSQQKDGTWRFCTSDIWDTMLTLRSMRGHPLFEENGRERAARFLHAQQNEDGGWPFRSGSGVESDNDTTATVMLALEQSPDAGDSIEKAVAYLGRVQTENGLWRTWQYVDDPPAEDVTAHAVAALNTARRKHTIRTEAARCWLSAQFPERNGWTASWYRGEPYAICEISDALGRNDPNAQAASVRLAQAQNPDGGWGPFPNSPSLPSDTGLAVATLLRQQAPIDSSACMKALEFLIASQKTDGSWPGVPEMFGPRPLLSHCQIHTQAFAIRGLIASERSKKTPQRR
jgi:squalene-hopene/tetraprenyl-beta-curcumene cyclase